ncbi:MAG: barstar family protein [Acidimicrobiales bacterium]
MIVERLIRVLSEQVFWILELNASDLSSAAWSWERAGLTVRGLRGRKMRTYADLFDESAAALQFPWYFGENIHAFDECIADLEWLPARAGYVLVISEPELLLSDEGSGSLQRLVLSFSDAIKEWAEPVALGEAWDRPAFPFHVVLACSENGAAPVAARWSSAGASVVPLAAPLIRGGIVDPRVVPLSNGTTH